MTYAGPQYCAFSLQAPVRYNFFTEDVFYLLATVAISTKYGKSLTKIFILYSVIAAL